MNWLQIVSMVVPLIIQAIAAIPAFFTFKKL